MTENTVNIPLLRKAVEWAEAEAAKPPELCEWYQPATYLTSVEAQEMGKAADCGSCYCVAGYVVATEIGNDDPYEHESGWQGVMPHARAILGLTREQADDLFAAANTIEDVRRIAESLAGERL